LSAAQADATKDLNVMSLSEAIGTPTEQFAAVLSFCESAECFAMLPHEFPAHFELFLHTGIMQR
jgi:hypothetical protein